MSDTYGAPFVFGIGHGSLGDESNDPAKIKDGWVDGIGLLFRDGVSSFKFNLVNWADEKYNMFANFGEGIWTEVGEWMNAPWTGRVLIQTLGVTGPYYDASGNSLYERNDIMFKITEGGREVVIPGLDVMDSKLFLIPSATARYPGEGWLPIGQLDMDE